MAAEERIAMILSIVEEVMTATNNPANANDNRENYLRLRQAMRDIRVVARRKEA